MIQLIDEACANGARLEIACAALEISPRSVQRWQMEGEIKVDGRLEAAQGRVPANKLSGVLSASATGPPGTQGGNPKNAGAEDVYTEVDASLDDGDHELMAKLGGMVPEDSSLTDRHLPCLSRSAPAHTQCWVSSPKLHPWQ
jgi:hypothetical protein